MKISHSTLITLMKDLKGSRVLCIGDAMVDRYVYGTVVRVSPEAPIPILRVDYETSMLGGAGNVVRNLVALGAMPVLISIRGDDSVGKELADLLACHSEVDVHLILESGRRTPLKTRFLARPQQLLRVDNETIAPLSVTSRRSLVERVTELLKQVEVIVLSDYDKGVLTDGVATELIAAANGRPVLVDPKGTNYSCYSGATLLTPNQRELAEATRLPTESEAEIVTAARHLIRTYAIGAILITRSQNGMTLVLANGTYYHLPAETREVFDVSGAGDTVIATLAASVASGVPLLEAAYLANVAAGIAVSKAGTAAVTTADVVATLHCQELDRCKTKVVSLEIVLEHIAKWRRCGLRIGFTNGCFDLLHPGHVSLLRQARVVCNRLIVGLNSDISVRRTKGSTRPVQCESARAEVLASLTDVDLVVLFSDDTPLSLLKAIRPDILIKGADYTVDTVVGASLVQEYGGTVLLASLEAGFSTTATIARMAQ